LRRLKAVGARSRARVASVREVPRSIAARLGHHLTLLERRIAHHTLNSRISGHEMPTAVLFRFADWRRGVSRVIGGRFRESIKSTLAQAVRFSARRSAHTAPCFRAGDFSPTIFPSFPARRGAQKTPRRGRPTLLSESWNQWPSGVAKIPKESRHWKAASLGFRV
jgi:hypothetical protein